MLTKTLEAEFVDWLRDAKGGDCFTYAIATCLQNTDDETKRVARLALRAHYDGKVELVQRRDGSVFEYLAIKTKAHVPVQIPWLSLKP